MWYRSILIKGECLLRRHMLHRSSSSTYEADLADYPVSSTSTSTIGKPSPILLRYQVLGRALRSDLARRIPPETPSAGYWDAPARTWHIGCSAELPYVQDMLFGFRHMPFRCSAYAVWMPRICSLDAPGQLTRVCTVALTLSPGLPYIRSTRGNERPSPSGAHFPPRS